MRRRLDRESEYEYDLDALLSFDGDHSLCIRGILRHNGFDLETLRGGDGLLEEDSISLVESS